MNFEYYIQPLTLFVANITTHFLITCAPTFLAAAIFASTFTLLLYLRITDRILRYKNYKNFMLLRKCLQLCTLKNIFSLFWNNVTMIVHFFCAHKCTSIH